MVPHMEEEAVFVNVFVLELVFNNHSELWLGIGFQSPRIFPFSTFFSDGRRPLDVYSSSCSFAGNAVIEFLCCVPSRAMR